MGLLPVLAAAACGLAGAARGPRVAERAAEREFGQFLGRSGYRVATEPVVTEPVVRITDRLLDAARSSPLYAARTGEVRWQITVIDDPDVSNAFVTPSGRVVVFTGMFSAAKTEAGLANVLGHELAHVLEQHHVREQALWDRAAVLAGLTGLAAGVATGLVGGNVDPGTVGRGVATTVGTWIAESEVLPYSRAQELAADRVGAQLAAQAGYDPREALAVLERLAAHTRSTTVSPRSTHPDRASRTAALQAAASDALILYRGNAPGATSPLVDPHAGRLPEHTGASEIDAELRREPVR